MASRKPTCTCCGNERRLEDYYASSSPFNKSNGKLHVCKECIWTYVESDSNNLDLVKDTLRMIDRPWQIDLWQSSVEEAEKANKVVFKIYMKNLGLRQNRELTWADSDFNTQKENDVLGNMDYHEIDDEELNDLVDFFGKGFTKEDYIWLQNEYTDFLNRYECDSKGMELLIKEICLTQLDIQIRRANKEKVDQQLKTLQDLLGSSNLKPVQETGANAVEQESFGTLIKKFEREKPIPEPDERWKDVDGIGKYIRTFFFGHMARAIGAENKFQTEYDEELNNYTVNQEDIDNGDYDE